MASYMLFSLLSIICILTAGVLVTRAIIASQSADSALSKISRLASAIELDYVKNQGSGVQLILTRAASSSEYVYLAVVSPTGEYLTHSDPRQIGSEAPVRDGSRLSWGNITGVSYENSAGKAFQEYSLPLSTHSERVGSLVISLTSPGWADILIEAGHYGLLVIVGPFVCILVGAFILTKMISPISAIDAQLALIAKGMHGSAIDPIRVRPSGVAAVGWNRLVEQIELMRDQVILVSEESVSQELKTHDSAQLDALNSLSDGVLVTDPEGRITFANHAIGALLGNDDLLESSEWISALMALCPEKAAEIAASEGNGRLTEDLPVEADGREVTLRLTRAPLRSETVEGAVWSLRDITQQQLANESRDRFIDTATHELRTPLANIKAYAETLVSSDLGDVEQQKEFCNTINTEATRLSRFVDDLLSISSIEVGSLSINRQNVEVKRLAVEVSDKVKPMMASKGIEYKVQLSEKLGEVSWDKDKVSGLLVNVLGNAAKYTPEGGRVEFAVTRDQGEVVFEIRDTGPGIAEDEQEKVFEKFFRSSNPEVRDQVGTGLGLPLAREIARMHGGDVTLNSVVDEGSVFTVTLPT